MGVSAEEYVVEVAQYLKNQNPASQYELLPVGDGKVKLSWSFQREGFKLYARWVLHPVPDHARAICFIMDWLSHRLDSTEEALQRKHLAFEKMLAEVNETQQQSERFAAEKKALEDDLYSKFILVLNAKKEKLRELRAKLQSKEHEVGEEQADTTDAEDGVDHGSTDESEREEEEGNVKKDVNDENMGPEVEDAEVKTAGISSSAAKADRVRKSTDGKLGLETGGSRKVGRETGPAGTRSDTLDSAGQDARELTEKNRGTGGVGSYDSEWGGRSSDTGAGMWGANETDSQTLDWKVYQQQCVDQARDQAAKDQRQHVERVRGQAAKDQEQRVDQVRDREVKGIEGGLDARDGGRQNVQAIVEKKDNHLRQGSSHTDSSVEGNGQTGGGSESHTRQTVQSGNRGGNTGTSAVGLGGFLGSSLYTSTARNKRRF
ncbi:hypothetical protein CBR_g33918 [Chara braunii]|uniref:XRCC4 coiled-coil domain-containing protein n=1 Tax=Chara braunii TaxID=69332 RepID=A0A388LHC1_CHABU|nr:hypothetical protein CBR_g33918 [Chara braunii]|eukprot:GBG81740.1 hypothetical protein CBR_g33918 [Chara braunii]